MARAGWRDAAEPSAASLAPRAETRAEGPVLTNRTIWAGGGTGGWIRRGVDKETGVALDAMSGRRMKGTLF